MWEKCVQSLYSSINNSKIYPKLIKPIDRMGRIRTAYLLCTRITLETTALRVIWELRSRRTGVFQRSRCVFLRGSEVLGGFFKFLEIMIFHHVWVPNIDPCHKIFKCTVLSTQWSSGCDILTKSSLKGPCITENCLQHL